MPCRTGGSDARPKKTELLGGAEGRSALRWTALPGTNRFPDELELVKASQQLLRTTNG